MAILQQCGTSSCRYQLHAQLPARRATSAPLEHEPEASGRPAGARMMARLACMTGSLGSDLRLHREPPGKRQAEKEGAMPKLLSPIEVERFRSEGYLSPIRVVSEDEAADTRARLEEFERRTGGPLRGDLRHK